MNMHFIPTSIFKPKSFIPINANSCVGTVLLAEDNTFPDPAELAAIPEVSVSELCRSNRVAITSDGEVLHLATRLRADKDNAVQSYKVLYRGTHYLRLWALLQRCDEDKEELQEACRTMEVLVMQIFVNHGWKFSNRICS